MLGMELPISIALLALLTWIAWIWPGFASTLFVITLLVAITGAGMARMARRVEG